MGQDDRHAVRLDRPSAVWRFWRRALREAGVSGQAARRAAIGLVTGADLTHAASIAFYALLSLFPFVLLLFSLLGTLATDEGNRSRVVGFLLRYFPMRLEFLTDQVDALRTERLRIGVFGGLSLVWASLGFFSAVAGAVNAAWGVTRPQGFWRHRLASLLMLLARDIATVLLICATGWIFYLVPNTRVRFRDVWVGAILTGLLWRLALWTFGWYLSVDQALPMIHGSITAVIVFLLWIYVSAAIFMYGVQFTAAHARLRRQFPRGPRPRRYSASEFAR